MDIKETIKKPDIDSEAYFTGVERRTVNLFIL